MTKLRANKVMLLGGVLALAAAPAAGQAVSSDAGSGGFGNVDFYAAAGPIVPVVFDAGGIGDFEDNNIGGFLNVGAEAQRDALMIRLFAAGSHVTGDAAFIVPNADPGGPFFETVDYDLAVSTFTVNGVVGLGQSRLRPYLGGGVGFSNADIDAGRFGDSSDRALAVRGVGGLDVYLTDRLSLGANASLNVAFHDLASPNPTLLLRTEDITTLNLGINFAIRL